MNPRLLLDTHILIHWLADPKRLTREQGRALEAAMRRGEPVALSAITLVEIAFLVAEGKLKLREHPSIFLEALENDRVYRILPLSSAVAVDAAALQSLKDLGDRVIAATARIHKLQLVTSDSRIIDSSLVSTVQ